MAGPLIFNLMLASAMLPFALLTWLVRQGHAGWALTVPSVLGAVFAVLLYASGRPFGIDPLVAMGGALLVCLPALLGCAAGGLLGWLLRRRDDRRG